MHSLPPAIVLFAAAIIVPLLPEKVRPWAFLVAPVFVLVQIMGYLEPGNVVHFTWLDFELIPLQVTSLNEVWATIFALVGVFGGVFALHLTDRAQQSAALAYLGGALGVVFAGDLITLVCFWESMAITSLMLIMNGGRPSSKPAATRYLFVHVTGGAILLAGVLWHIAGSGSIDLHHFGHTAAAWLVLSGISINAAVVPLHAWLADAYPESSPTGMVFLGAFTTKTAVYVMMAGFLGWSVLLVLGPIMAVYAAVYALLQNDIRRILAYHIISQIGFMVTAIGVSAETAQEAVADQAFTHVLWPTLMVMAAGAVIHAVGASKLTDLGGLSTRLRAVLGLYMVGAISIALFPLLTGLGAGDLYAAGNVNAGSLITFVLYIAAAGTTLAVAVKLPYYAFFGPRHTPVQQPVPPGMIVGMAAAAVLSIAVGLFPQTTFDLLQLDLHAHPFTSANVISGLEVFVASVAASWLALRWLAPRDTVTLDTDWFYRKSTRLVRIAIQQPIEWPFTQTQRVMIAIVGVLGKVPSAPNQLWARVLPKRSEPAVVMSLLVRPPVGVAVGLVFVTFALVFLASRVFG